MSCISGINVGSVSPLSPSESLVQAQSFFTTEEELTLVKEARFFTDELQKASQFLEKQARIHTMDLSQISMDKLIAFKALKKECKDFFSKSESLLLSKYSLAVFSLDFQENPSPEMNAFLDCERAFDAFIDIYDSVCKRHLLLNELKEIHSELRKTSNTTLLGRPSERLIRFYSLFSPIPCYDLDNYSVRIQMLQQKEHWRQLVNSCLSNASQVQRDSSFFTTRPITWSHGTKSSSFEVMKKMDPPALVPLGELLEENIAPLSGEICGSDVGINEHSLSGEPFSPHWEEEPAYYLNASTRFLITRLYASQETGYYFNEKLFDPGKAWERISIPILEKVLQRNLPFKNIWPVMRVDILRLRMTDPEAEYKLQSFQKRVLEEIDTKETQISLLLSHANEKIKAFNNPQLSPLPSDLNEMKARLREILKGKTFFSSDISHLQDLALTLSEALWLRKFKQALTSEIPIRFTLEKLEMLKAPYPIVFSSSTAEAVPLQQESFTTETLFPGRALLGRDIQMAFTDKDHVEPLQRDLEPYGVRVFPLETAHVLEMEQMMRGSFLKKLEALPLGEQMSSIIQRDFLPLYTRPFPANPSYFNPRTGKREPSSHFPNHSVYLSLIEEGKITPRDIHGTMHAARTAIWTQLYAALAEKAGEDVVEDRFLLALAGASHDIAREDEGVDRWDAESGAFLKAYLLQQGLNVETARHYAHAIAEKDPEGGRFTSPDQRAVHDADCLEIMRLTGLRGFRMSELQFYHFKGLDQKDEIIAEVADFIQMTEPLKLQMEQSSKNLIGDLLKLMEKERFPLLNELLAPLFDRQDSIGSVDQPLEIRHE